MLGLGGSHIGYSTMSDPLAVRIIRTAIDSGITFMDNSWGYHGGRSERRLGDALKDGYREKAFVMTKIDGRTRKEALKQLDESLRRLKSDSVDLLQHHEIIRFDDVDRIFSAGGALEGLVRAREAGKLRFIGFTGHKDPHIHLYMLEIAKKHRFHFDTVQMPLNPMDAHFRSFQKLVLPVLVKERIGVLGMKPIAGGVLLRSKVVTAQECLRYALSLPTSVVITGIDSLRVLRQNLRIAAGFSPMTKAEVTRLLAKTARAASTGEYELFKVSTYYDSTIRHPEWLGDDSQRTTQLSA